MIRRHVIVRGKVQGVWFRGSTEQAARAAGVAGWVRNRSDGSVEAVFEGQPEAVARALASCRPGAPLARVTHFEATAEPPEHLVGFEVR
jgi:acylphosphatase